MSFSVLHPTGSYSSTCGYCSPPGTRSETDSNIHSASCLAQMLTCRTYQDMIDRGWRRSGTFCYKPDMKRTCCPQYTIKLDAAQFKPTKSHRKCLNRWTRYVTGREGDTQLGSIPHRREFGLVAAVHEPEANNQSTPAPTRSFEVSLEPSSYSDEKYELYRTYQQHVHKDKETSRTGFKRFLVHSPLMEEEIPYLHSPPPTTPQRYGSYHQTYRVDGRLIALSILDILPSCVSSVYFIYDPKLEKFSLGKISVLREIALVNEMREAGAPGMQYLYLGYYVHSCPKMKYKGEYSPSFLQDPSTYDWYPIEICQTKLDHDKYAQFSTSIDRQNEAATTSDDNMRMDNNWGSFMLRYIFKGRLRQGPLKDSPWWWDEQIRESAISTLEELGSSIADSIILSL